jgi:hypothetical protein
MRSAFIRADQPPVRHRFDQEPLRSQRVGKSPRELLGSHGLRNVDRQPRTLHTIKSLPTTAGRAKPDAPWGQSVVS